MFAKCHKIHFLFLKLLGIYLYVANLLQIKSSRGGREHSFPLKCIFLSILCEKKAISDRGRTKSFAGKEMLSPRFAQTCLLLVEYLFVKRISSLSNCVHSVANFSVNVPIKIKKQGFIKNPSLNYSEVL